MEQIAAALRPLFERVAKAYLIGAAADLFADTLGGDVPFEHCGSLDVATKQAAAEARAEAERTGVDQIVLLSGPRFAGSVHRLRAARRRFREFVEVLLSEAASPT